MLGADSNLKDGLQAAIIAHARVYMLFANKTIAVTLFAVELSVFPWGVVGLMLEQLSPLHDDPVHCAALVDDEDDTAAFLSTQLLS